MRNVSLIRHHPQGLTESYQAHPCKKRDLPDTCTIVQSRSNVTYQVAFWCWLCGQSITVS